MKYLLGLLLMCTTAGFAQKSIFDGTATNPSKQLESLQNYRGKKIIIAVLDINSIQHANLRSLDSIQKNEKNIQVIIIPQVGDDSTANKEILQLAEDTYQYNFLVGKPAYIGKETDRQPDGVTRFITAAEENTHFSAPVVTGCQLYIVSESGVLYAVLENGLQRPALLKEILQQIYSDDNQPTFKSVQ